ncbi:agmatine deiminase family protein [Microbacterium trichothecenolyticum]|uniref:Agmatine deiminase n=1 Tax=Microbacterium trichothecenolyticum TaxID=69370 RepID=A0ABU0TUU5_MICTR|nr:agmatine deiminase family protein [Microbacterium trichothecenolyticum]MDQ1123433.1 agmatine deiminase [Microbacterium trichothecenolyticum]
MWRMPAESARHERTWMAFPREGVTLGEGTATREEGYRAWADVAHAVAQFEPVTMVVDPTEMTRARRMLTSSIEIVEAPLDEFWMRDVGPTFVVDPDRPGVLGAVDWIFNGWGAPDWAEWQKSALLARVVAEHVGAERIDSLLVAEGGGLHVDGEGTVLLTETVQLDPRRNPFADRARVEAEMARTIGATDAVWLSRGLTRDYDDFGTNGHVDIVATFAAPDHVLIHDQTDADHPDHEVSRLVRRELSDAFAALGRTVTITGVPAPSTVRDDHGWVDWSYINHLVTNDGVVLCGFGDETADARARDIVADAYPGRRVVTVDARALFDRGGGIHCITQQQPTVN